MLRCVQPDRQHVDMRVARIAVVVVLLTVSSALTAAGSSGARDARVPRPFVFARPSGVVGPLAAGGGSVAWFDCLGVALLAHGIARQVIETSPGNPKAC